MIYVGQKTCPKMAQKKEKKRKANVNSDDFERHVGSETHLQSDDTLLSSTNFHQLLCCCYRSNLRSLFSPPTISLS